MKLRKLTDLISDVGLVLDVISGMTEIFGNYCDSVTICVEGTILYNLQDIDNCYFYVYQYKRRMTLLVIPCLTYDAGVLLSLGLKGLDWHAAPWIHPEPRPTVRLVYQPKF